MYINIIEREKMGGSVHGTRCQCGHESSVSVGGNTECEFPFYCKECGLVSVNIMGELNCPICSSAEINEYGKEPISIKDVSDEYPVIQCYDYEAYWHGNLCPICKQHTMRFGPAEIFFD